MGSAIVVGMHGTNLSFIASEQSAEPDRATCAAF